MAVKSNILLESGTNELEVVEFVLEYPAKGGKIVKQSFGINVAKVREIIRMPKLTHMPNLHHSVYGIFNLRNKIIPALDLCKYLFNYENLQEDRKMIIAEFNKIQAGFIVNDVRSIHRISWKEIESPEALQSVDANNSSIIGFIKFDDRNILMLDVEQIVVDIDPASALDFSKPKEKLTWKPKVVTAEDSVTIRKMITDRLQKSGFEIISFNDGAEAWNYMQEISSRVSQGEKLDDLVNAVITDIEMPKMDGYSLTKHVKDDPYLNSLPVIIFSSIITKDIRHKGVSVGADAQMSKPQIGSLLEILYELIKKPND